MLDSRNFFSDVVPPHKRNQFGGSVGGPIKKDKLFFFANYEGTRDRAPQTQLSRIPTDLEKAGNLSDLGETLIDPQTGLPFPGAVIPADRIDSISKAVMAYYPEPNVPSDPNINYRYNSPSIENDYTGMGRIDFNISPRHTLMGRYALNNGYRFTGGSYPKVGGEILPQRFQNGALTLTSNLTPQLLNEARFTYDRSVSNGRGQNTGSTFVTNLNLPFSTDDPVQRGFFEDIDMYSTVIGSFDEYPQAWLLQVNTFQWYDGITWMHGKHAIKAGLDIHRIQADSDFGTHANGQYYFYGQYTGDGFAEFLLGEPSVVDGALHNSAQQYRETQMAYYIADEWRAKSNLTVNLGFRYEYYTAPWEKSGETPVFDPTLGNGIGGLLYPANNRHHHLRGLLRGQPWPRSPSWRAWSWRRPVSSRPRSSCVPVSPPWLAGRLRTRPTCRR